MKKFFGNVFAVIVGNLLTILVVGAVLTIIGAISMMGTLFQGKGPKSDSVLEITFDSSIKESSMDEELTLFGPEPGSSLYFRDIIRSIEKAKDDDKIKGISLKVESFEGGISQLSDIRNALIDFKKSGKFIYAYSHNSTQGGYILNSTADSIFQNPMGMVLVQGLSSEVMFYKNLGDKYGVDFQVIRHGAYKSAVEPYLRDDLSPENREQLSLLLNDIWSNLSTQVTQSRKFTNDSWKTAVDSLYSFNPEKALEYKLVDKLSQETEYDEFIAKRLNLDVDKDESVEEELDKHTIALEDYRKTLKSESGDGEVAVLYASGMIIPGEGYTGIQSDVYKKAIRDLTEDDDVKAVVLRVNSPGGSADASEEILFELSRLHAKKPIIVSFGDVAASGGYYISMESDSIFANPNTITGSIGVLGMVPSIKQLANNVGITTDYVNTNENSDFLKTPFKPLSESGMKAMTNITESTYDRFVQHVMKARKMSFEQVDSIGGGRVWSGKQAIKIGLIDRFGTLDDAIAAAAKKAGLSDYSIGNYPYKKGGFEEYMKQFQGIQSEAYIQEELGPEYFKVYKDLRAMKEYKGVQLRLPFELKLQ